MPSNQITETNFAQLFRTRSAKFGGKVRWRQKRDGSWLRASWRENQRMVNSLVAGLDEIGARRGDVIGIASSTRWEWAVADWANIGLGAATVTLYPSNTPAVNSFILNDSGACYVFAEDKSQYDKLNSIRAEITLVRRAVQFDQMIVYFRLVAGIPPFNRRRDFFFHVRDRAQDTFTAVALFVAIA